MLAIVLGAVGLAGGAVLTYAFMDQPRREAVRRRVLLDRERDELAARRAELDRTAAESAERTRRLAEATARLQRDTAELASRQSEFQRRAVAYSDLAAENRILKADLRNLTVRLARHQYGQQQAATEQGGLARSLGDVARWYLAEVRTAARKGLTPSNYHTVKQRVRTAFARVRVAGVDATPAEEAEALAELHELYEKAVRTAVEREEQTRLRESIREDQRREREAQEEIRRAEAERAAVAAALRAAEAAARSAFADAEGRHAAEIDALRTKLAEAEAKSQRAISEAQKTKVGHVYVISNVGSFGRDVYKIGMTRRIEPGERLDELSGAAVPFRFDVHMMIKTDDAPALEATLHRIFHKQRVNKANPRKEFFRASIEDIVAAVREHHGEVEYKADAEALEWMASQTMTEQDLAETEQAFADAERIARAHLGGLAPGDDE